MQFHIHKRYIVIILTVLGAILALLIFWLVQQTLEVSQARIINRDRLTHLKMAGPLGPNGVYVIEPWMTFDYINRMFNLPTNYLQSAIPVTDTQYPHLSLERYALERGVPGAEFVDQVKNAVSGYFTETPQK